jgi:hypothetical protein
MLARDKHSSLLRKFVNYRRKNTYKMWPRGQCYHTFLSVIYMFLCKACVSRLEKLAWDKRSNLLREFVNYGQKCFIRLGPGTNVIKLFCPYFRNTHNKLECLSQASFSRLETQALHKNM